MDGRKEARGGLAPGRTVPGNDAISPPPAFTRRAGDLHNEAPNAVQIVSLYDILR